MIAAMPEIDALTIGPADLGQDLGVTGKPDAGRVRDERGDEANQADLTRRRGGMAISAASAKAPVSVH